MAEMEKNIWVDIDNTPNIQYILPVANAFREKGYGLVITARDYGQIVELLELRKIDAKVIGSGFHRNKFIKVFQTLVRALMLVMYVKHKKCIASLSNSRSAALASRLLGIKNFTFCDFEYSELKSYATLGSYVVFPSVIPEEEFLRAGFTATQLIKYEGIKENLTLSNFKIPNRVPLSYIDKDKILVILRAPSDNSHYFQNDTGILFQQLEQYLTERIRSHNLQILISPRNTDQTLIYKKKYALVEGVRILENAVEGLDLIWYADLVFTGGGTMAREAAVLGKKAYSVFLSQTGAVDRYLESIGRLIFIRGADDFGKIELRKSDANKFESMIFSKFPSYLSNLIEDVIDNG
jgi:predicted glycosyltransferase